MFSWLNRSKSKPIDKSLQQIMDRNERYGAHPVPAARIHVIAAEMINAKKFQLDPLKDGKWARVVDNDISHFLFFGLSKGFSCSFTWGLSLAFVPHAWDPKPKFHRTLKSARCVLYETVGDFVVADVFSEKVKDFFPDFLHGEECFRNDLQRAWAGLEPYLANWFQTTSTIGGVLAKAKSHAEKDWQSFRHVPDPRMVYAFTLARAGRRDEGLAILRQLAAADRETYGAAGLEAALIGTDVNS